MIEKKIIALVVTGGMLASIGLTAGAYTKTAATNSKVKAKSVQEQRENKRPMWNGQMNMKSQLDALVKSGKITQAVEDKVVAYLNQKDITRKAEMDKVKAMTEADRKAYFETKVKAAKTDLFTEMVTSGVITQLEADAIKAAVPQMSTKGNGMMEGRHGRGNFNPADMQKEMKTKLDTLVTAGTINQATEDAVIANFNKIYADRKAEMDKVKAMTEAERKTYFDSKVKTERVDPLTTMVKAGTLTQAQADAIKKVMPGHQRGGKMHRDRH